LKIHAENLVHISDLKAIHFIIIRTFIKSFVKKFDK
jgi:hypothetical protein